MFVFYFDLKNIYKNFVISRDGIELSINLMQDKDYFNAYYKSQIIKKELEDLSAQVEKYKDNQYVKYFNYLSMQVKSLQDLINFTSFFNNTILEVAVNQINIDSVFESKNIIDYEKFDTSSLDYDFSSFNAFNVLLKMEFSNLERQADNFLEISQELLPEFKFLSKLFGFNEKSSFLILFHDNENIKATGGSIEAYGILEIDQGQITRFNAYEINDLNDLAGFTLNDIPPQAMIQYGNISTWLPGDVNWYPDWPETAKKFQWFFENSSSTNKNYSEKLDGVISFNFRIFEDILEQTGDVNVYGENINDKNFRDILKDKDKKYIIGLISGIYKNIIDVNDLNLRNIFYDNIKLKNILFYFNDQEIEHLSSYLNYGGAIRKTEGDYLMVVDHFFSGVQKDLQEDVFYTLTEEDSKLSVDLNINYANTSFDDHSLYLRIYVPSGSELLSCNEEKIEIYKEYEKTVFAFPLTLNAESMKNVNCKYYLPENLKQMLNKGQYSIYVQKQSGKELKNMTVDLNFINDIKLYKPADFFVEHSNNKIKWEKSPETDLEFFINF